jgi:hypothetical protein
MMRYQVFLEDFAGAPLPGAVVDESIKKSGV